MIIWGRPEEMKEDTEEVRGYGGSERVCRRQSEDPDNNLASVRVFPTRPPSLSSAHST